LTRRSNKCRISVAFISTLLLQEFWPRSKQRNFLPRFYDRTARLWEADSGKLLATFQGHTSVVYSSVFSPDGRRVVTGIGNITSGSFLATPFTSTN
jgi:WD40 repeat protein